MFEFDFGHGEDLDLLRETVRSFARDRIAPRAAEIDANNVFPRELWPELGELGLLGITVEAEFGGSELGYLAHVIAMEEISRASGVDRPVLWRAFESLCQPAAALGQCRAEAAVPAEACFR